MNSAIKTLLIVVTALALSACSEELTTQAKKAAAEIAVEANKALTQVIVEVKNDTIDQLKNLNAETEAQKIEKPEEAEGKNSDEQGK
jgi:hypothetical protein